MEFKFFFFLLFGETEPIEPNMSCRSGKFSVISKRELMRAFINDLLTGNESCEGRRHMEEEQEFITDGSKIRRPVADCEKIIDE